MWIMLVTIGLMVLGVSLLVSAILVQRGILVGALLGGLLSISAFGLVLYSGLQLSSETGNIDWSAKCWKTLPEDVRTRVQFISNEEGTCYWQLLEGELPMFSSEVGRY